MFFNLNVDIIFFDVFLGNRESIKIGLFNEEDYGNICLEIFEFCIDMFNVRYFLIDGVVNMYIEFSDFWLR